MPVNKYALIRYQVIDRCIRNKYQPFPSKEDLRRACEEALYGEGAGRVSDSTLDKDIYAMKNDSSLAYHAPIVFDKIKGGYYYSDENYSLNGLNLSPTEIDAIRISMATLTQFRDNEWLSDLWPAMQKIYDKIQLSEKADPHALQEIVQFENLPTLKGNEWIAPIFDAIRFSYSLDFSYENIYKNEIKKYLIEPYLLKEYRNRWYMIGYSPTHREYRTFGLDRMSKVKIISVKRDVRTDFNTKNFFRYSIGITESKGKALDIYLSFDPVVGKLILSQPVHGSQKVIKSNTKEIQIAIKVLPGKELLSLLLSFGNSVRVVKPESIKKMMHDEIKSMLKNYSN